MTQGIQETPFNVDELQERLRKMSDVELRKFGQAAQHMASPKANPGQPLQSEGRSQPAPATAKIVFCVVDPHAVNSFSVG